MHLTQIINASSHYVVYPFIRTMLHTQLKRLAKKNCRCISPLLQFWRCQDAYETLNMDCNTDICIVSKWNCVTNLRREKYIRRRKNHYYHQTSVSVTRKNFFFCLLTLVLDVDGEVLLPSDSIADSNV